MPLLVESSGIFDYIPFCSFLRKLFCNLFLLSFSSFICFASLFFIYFLYKRILQKQYNIPN